MLELARKSDSVELKLTVPATDHRTAISSLGLDPLEAQIRQVFFFDTPDLDLNAVGVVARARQDSGARWRYGREAPPGRPGRPSGRAAPLTERRRRGRCDARRLRVLSIAEGEGGRADPCGPCRSGSSSARKIFSKEQRTFFDAHAPDGITLKDLSVLGPIFVLKQNFTPPELARRLTAELWFYPDGSRILELSTKCTAADAFQVSAEARLYLTEKGVSLEGKQETKTKAALNFFSKQLRAASSNS